MKIETKFDIGQIIYVNRYKPGEQETIQAIQIRGNGIFYQITNNPRDIISENSTFSNEKDARKAWTENELYFHRTKVKELSAELEALEKEAASE